MASSSQQLNDPSSGINIGMCKYGGKCMFIWDGLNLKIQLPLLPLVQSQDGCSYASVTRQTQLSVVINFGEAGHTVVHQFDHFYWEDWIKKNFPTPLRPWEPMELLNLISSEHVSDHLEASRCGLPLKVGDDTRIPHWVSKTFDYFDYIHGTNPPKGTTQPPDSLLRHWLLELRIPLIATIPIVEGYPTVCEEPYVGLDHKKKKILSYFDADVEKEEYKTHSVVLVGVYEPSLENPKRLDTSVQYYIYQGSFLECDMKEVEEKSFLPCGMSIVSSHLIERVCFGINYPPSVMIQEKPPSSRNLFDMRAQLTKVHDEQRTAAKVGLLWKKLVEHS